MLIVTQNDYDEVNNCTKPHRVMCPISTVRHVCSEKLMIDLASRLGLNFYGKN